MVVKLKFNAVGHSSWWEFLIRFLLGGLATVFAGVMADEFGSHVGGLFLAFPSILVASLTLVEKHQRDRKRSVGMTGDNRGRDAAALDCRGAALGAGGLIAFGAIVYLATPEWGLTTLALALAAWIIAIGIAWKLRRCRSRQRIAS